MPAWDPSPGHDLHVGIVQRKPMADAAPDKLTHQYACSRSQLIDAIHTMPHSTWQPVPACCPQTRLTYIKLLSLNQGR